MPLTVTSQQLVNSVRRACLNQLLYGMQFVAQVQIWRFAHPSARCCAGHHSSGALHHAHTIDGPVAFPEPSGIPAQNGKTHWQGGSGGGSPWQRQNSDPVPLSVPEHKAVSNGSYVPSKYTTLQVNLLHSRSPLLSAFCCTHC